MLHTSSHLRSSAGRRHSVMPRSKAGSFDSDLSFDLLGPMNAGSPYPSFSKPGTAVSSSNLSSLQSNAWKRQSLPANNSYASLLARTDFDALRARRAGDRSSMNSNANGSHDHASRQRPQFYEEHLKYKDTPPSAARERVQRESPVIAELRTNVIIKDEFTLVTDLSYHLASRYARPDSSIMVKVDHSACLALAGTFDPCYILSITAVSSQMSPITNKRNAALIQSFMADILSVPPDRGIVKFESMAVENFAINGSTLLGEIERQEKQLPTDAPAVRRTGTNASRKSLPSYKQAVPKVEEESNAEPPIPNGNPERSGSIVSATDAASPAGVFELPGEVDRKRPSTVHNHPERIRPNGIGNSDLPSRAAANTDERPKSRAGNGPSIQDQLREMREKPMPSRDPSSQRTAILDSIGADRRQSSHLKTDPTARQTQPLPPPISKPVQSARHSQIVTADMKAKPRDSYLEGFTDDVVSKKASDSSMTDSADAAAMATTAADKADKDKKDPTANTAKRRSTITAVPKLPQPPPVPSSETTSAKSVKIGKRKSFLSAFRRSAAAH